MTKGRIEAFSDGVFAIIITIMVLEMKVPHGATFESLKPILPVFLSYILSFTYVGIYWNNHHHMFHIVKHVSGTVLWTNLHLLFWLSLFPFVTGWMGENHFESLPVATYGVVAAMAGLAYNIFARCLARLHGKDSPIAMVVQRDRKGMISIVFYIAGVGLSFFKPWLGLVMYVIVAIMWFIPDRGIEKNFRSSGE